MHEADRVPPSTASASPRSDDVGIVAIGRNEGERLRRCLASIRGPSLPVVYVDSGSTDGSQETARQADAAVVELDRSAPFTAARARNAGFAALLRGRPGLEFVQFVDGDCELAPRWLELAVARLREDARLAAVCGRRREANPDASVFNRLCDMEWDTQVGNTLACGGDAMMRVAALRGVGGFAPDLIAGEEPELCLRLRRAGWRIQRLDAEMTRHDAAMVRFGQWWRRAVRAGYALAEGLAMYGSSYPRTRGALSAPFWAVLVPAATILAVLVARDVAPGHAWLPPGCALLGYAALLVRIARGRASRSGRRAHAFTYAFFCVLGKWAETQGMLTYAWRRGFGAERRLIEYKS